MRFHPLLNNSSSGVDALSDPALTKFWPFFFALVGLFEAADAAFTYDKPAMGGNLSLVCKFERSRYGISSTIQISLKLKFNPNPYLQPGQK